MKNTSGSLSSYFKPLAFGATFDILFNISGLTFPGISFKASKGLCNTGVAREDVIMGIGDELALVIGAGHNPCYSGHIAIGKPMLTREERDDFVLFEIFGIENRRSGESISNSIMKALYIGDLNPIVGKLNTPLCMSI